MSEFRNLSLSILKSLILILKSISGVIGSICNIFNIGIIIPRLPEGTLIVIINKEVSGYKFQG